MDYLLGRLERRSLIEYFLILKTGNPKILSAAGYIFPVFALSELRPCWLDAGCFRTALPAHSRISRIQHQASSIFHA
jgi:hypothetical protein